MYTDYYREKFIQDGAEKLRFEAYRKSLERIRTAEGEEAYIAELLSDKPIKSHCVIKDPKFFINLMRPIL